MRAGELDRRITIRRFTSTTHPGTGLPVETWADLATVWASWRRASARETLAASEIGAEVTDVFETRWSPLLEGVTAKDRIRFKGKEYDLIPPKEIGRREGMRFEGSARADQPEEDE